MSGKNVYKQNGYKDRFDYLNLIAGDYGTDMMVITSLAEVLGENEDFDGLISALEDIPIF